MLFDGDLITLQAEAKILFDVNNDTKIQIQGPAQFVIRKREQGGYHLNLISGEYISIEAEKAESILEVETDHLSIETQKNKEVRLELSQKNHKLQLKNSGAELSIKNKKSSTPSEVQQLAQAKVLTIQDNDISKIEDIATFKRLLVNNENITHTLSLKQAETSTGELNLEEISAVLKEENKPSINLSKEELITINEQISAPTSSKKIPTEEQLSHITAALNSKFLLDDLQQLFLAKKQQNTEAVAAVHQIFKVKIQSLGVKYQITISATSSLSDQISELLKGLETYHMPPSKTHQLKVLKNWITTLQTLDASEESWESFLQHLPASLKFQ